MKVTILGTLKGKSKTGKDFQQIFAQKDFTQYERDNNECAGSACFVEFTYANYPVKPGDVCEFSYEPGYQGRATLTDVKILKA